MLDIEFTIKQFETSKVVQWQEFNIFSSITY